MLSPETTQVSSPAIAIEGLKVHFGARSAGGSAVRAVDGVTLSIPRGTFHGVIGESGCGKTTLARTIIGLQRETEGRILVSGKDRATWRHDDPKSPASRHTPSPQKTTPPAPANPRSKCSDIVINYQIPPP